MINTDSEKEVKVVLDYLREKIKCPVKDFDSVNMFYRKMTELKWYFKINLNEENRSWKRKSPKASRPYKKAIS